MATIISGPGAPPDNSGKHQFFCVHHNYGWSINEDGIDEGCYYCNLADEEAAKVDAAYELYKEGQWR